MRAEQPSSGILLALIVALTAAVLLLGIELSMVLKQGDELSRSGSAALSAAACALYAAAAWRGAQGEGTRLFVQWWGTMLVGHLGLGVLIGLFRATLVAASFNMWDLLRWAGGISLPVVVLQAGYAVGMAALAYGGGPQTIAAEPVQEHSAQAEAAAEPVPVPREPEAGAPTDRLQVYATAIDRLQAPDHPSLLRFATQAAKCEGGLLTARDGKPVACVGVDETEAERIGTALPHLMAQLAELARPARPSATMLHAAFGGYELLTAAGDSFIACLIGPQPGSRETAEVILPVLLARAEALKEKEPEADAAGPTEGGRTS